MSTNKIRQVRLADLFEVEHTRKAQAIVRSTDGVGAAVDRIEREIVRDRMPHIDRVTGQLNMPRYVAYVLYAAVTRDT